MHFDPFDEGWELYLLAAFTLLVQATVAWTAPF